MKKFIILFALFACVPLLVQAQFTVPVEYKDSIPHTANTGYVAGATITRGYGATYTLLDPLWGYRIKQISVFGAKKTDSIAIWGGWNKFGDPSTGHYDTNWVKLWVKPLRGVNPAINTAAGSGVLRDTLVQWMTDVGLDKGTDWGTYDFSQYNYKMYRVTTGVIDTGKIYFRIIGVSF